MIKKKSKYPRYFVSARTPHSTYVWIAESRFKIYYRESLCSKNRYPSSSNDANNVCDDQNAREVSEAEWALMKSL